MDTSSLFSDNNDIHLVHCVIPGCTRLFVSTDPSAVITTLGALPDIGTNYRKAEWYHARETYVPQCNTCQRDIPESVVETDPPCTTVSENARIQWDIMRTFLADARWRAEQYSAANKNALTDEEEEFLSQDKIPCALPECSHRFDRSDRVVTMTRRGAVPPTSNLCGDQTKTYCILEMCGREVEEPEWVKSKNMVERHRQLGDLLIEWVKKRFREEAA